MTLFLPIDQAHANKQHIVFYEHGHVKATMFFEKKYL